MELSRRDFRVMKFYDCMKKGLHQEQSLENLKQLFGKNAPSRTQVFFWFCEFSRCRGVSMMRTGAAHQRLPLFRLQTSRQRKNESGPNQGLPLERFTKVLAIGTAATMSILHDHLRVQDLGSMCICHVVLRTCNLSNCMQSKGKWLC